MGTKISAQTETTTPASTHEIPLNAAGAGRRATLANVRSNIMAVNALPVMLPYFTDSNYYLGSMVPPSTSNVTGAAQANTDVLLPVIIPYTRTFTEIACVCTASAAGNLRLGIYNANQTTGQPTTNIVDSGDIAVTVAKKTYAISQSLTGGQLYYLAINFSGTPTMVANVPMSFNGLYLGSAAGAQSGGLTKARAYAAFIDQTAVTFNVNPNNNVALPVIGIR